MYVIASLGAIVRNPAWDVVVVLFFLAAGFIGGSMGGGRVKLLSMLFANYIALFVAPLMFGLLDVYQVAKGNASRNIVMYFILLGVLFLLFQPWQFFLFCAGILCYLQEHHNYKYGKFPEYQALLQQHQCR